MNNEESRHAIVLERESSRKVPLCDVLNAEMPPLTHKRHPVILVRLR